MKKILYIFSLILVFVSFFFIIEKPNKKNNVILGAGNKESAKIENLEDVNLLIDSLKEITQNSTGAKKMSSEEDSYYETMTYYEQSKQKYNLTNSYKIGEETINKNVIVEMTRELQIFYAENGTYYISKGEMILEETSTTYEESSVFSFDLELYMSKDYEKVLVKFNKFMLSSYSKREDSEGKIKKDTQFLNLFDNYETIKFKNKWIDMSNDIFNGLEQTNELNIACLQAMQDIINSIDEEDNSNSKYSYTKKNGVYEFDQESIKKLFIIPLEEQIGTVASDVLDLIKFDKGNKFNIDLKNKDVNIDLVINANVNNNTAYDKTAFVLYSENFIQFTNINNTVIIGIDDVETVNFEEFSRTIEEAKNNE